MLTENDITELLVRYLLKQNYSINSHLTTTQKGIDIEATSKDGQKLCIEVKGETSARLNSSRYGQYFTNNQVWTHVSVAVMKTLKLMSKDKYKDCLFAMAFPLSHKPLLKEIEHATKRLGITVYFVSLDGVEIM